MRRFLLPLLVALGVLATAVPARAAGPLQFDDTKGDGQLVVTPVDGGPDAVVPIPNEPSLDVTRVRIERKGDNILWTINIEKLAATNPSGSTGVAYEVDWNYDGGSFRLAIVDDTFWKSSEFRGGTLGSTNPTPCGGCKGLIDRKSSKVVFTTPVSGLSRAIRAAVSTAKPLGPGSKFDSVEVSAQRTYSMGDPNIVAFRYPLTADDAKAPPGAAFTL